MLKSIFSPLRSGFSLASPRSTTTEPSSAEASNETPEDFARDAMIELMRVNVDELRLQVDSGLRMQILTEIDKVLVADPSTKEVFRELDGFLTLISISTSLDVGNRDTTELFRLVFVVLNRALLDCYDNQSYFETRVGWDSLRTAISPLMGDLNMETHAIALLISLALSDLSLYPALCALSSTLKKENCAILNLEMAIRNPQAIFVLLNCLTSESPVFLAVLILLELLLTKSHWNRAQLYTQNITFILLSRYNESTCNDEAKSVILKILKQLLELGVESQDLRRLLRLASPNGKTLDSSYLQLLSSAMKPRWPRSFLFRENAKIETVHTDDHMSFSSGLSFMAWVYIESMPVGQPLTLFAIYTSTSCAMKLILRSDGGLEYFTNTSLNTVVFSGATVVRGAWSHIALVHSTLRAPSVPSLRLFLDGSMTDSMDWSFPRLPRSNPDISYMIGDISGTSSWLLSTASFLSVPLGSEAVRLIHHLGPRYHSKFQTQELVRLLTYEASTSLNIHLLGQKESSDQMTKLLRRGLDIHDASVVFLLSPVTVTVSDSVRWVPNIGSAAGRMPRVALHGNILSLNSQCMDDTLWEIGGPVLCLSLITLAQNTHDFSNALAMLTGCLRSNWKNSEEMERICGFEILAAILRAKSHLLDLDGFHILFRFLGCRGRPKGQCVVTSTVAYSLIALDFNLWSHSSKEIQQAHCDHFRLLLVDSVHARFNIRRKLAKLGVIRKMLFALQTSWYHDDDLPFLMEGLRSCVQSNFSPDDAIKPLISYIAANLHEAEKPAVSPQSFVSHLDSSKSRERATMVLALLTSILHSKPHLAKFTSSLPFSRTCLLLLGDAPSSSTATQVLILLKLALHQSTSFARKFELVNGWLILRFVIPKAWSPSVQTEIFNILLGRGSESWTANDHKLFCPQIFPAILASFHHLLGSLSAAVLFDGAALSDDIKSTVTYDTIDMLVEELISVHGDNESFSRLFRHQQAAAAIASAYKTFITKADDILRIPLSIVRLMEKLNNFVLLLVLDANVESSQRNSLLDTLQKSQKLCGTTDSLRRSMPTNGSALLRTLDTSSNLDIVGERTYYKSANRIREWREVIILSEKRRFSKNLQDMREQLRSLADLEGWRRSVLEPPGLWCDVSNVMLWKLDLTEGPFRVRKRLEFDHKETPTIEAKNRNWREVSDIHTDTESIVQVEMPPWAEDSRVLSGSGEDEQIWTDDLVEDKHRRVRHTLEPGDVIELVQNVTRVIGVDAFPALLILGKSHLYIIEGYVETPEGELIDARDAPPESFALPITALSTIASHKPQRWPYDQCFSCSKRTSLFRDVALELYFRNCQNLLLVFQSHLARRTMHHKLQEKLGSRLAEGRKVSITRRTPLFGKFTFGLSLDDEVSTALRRWQAREISNFSYLSILNQVSGRTPSDATQYPVFPWILQDYTSLQLDLRSPTSFRDLSLPMGALTEARRETAQTRYDSLVSVDEVPFHYGTHFSSAMIVCHFLIRLEPFTHMFKTLQGGDWDLPDRLFSDVSAAYESASSDSRGDVRELIGEFFTCPEFLENLSNHDFGVQQRTGQRIHDVILPPWAKNNPLLFIHLHRQALESDYVSANLHKWIDLIWGVKQRDKEALNCFHPLSYEGQIDLDKISDELERKATVGIIHNFGQTPRKLFDVAHAPRLMHGTTTLPIGTTFGIEEEAHLLLQSSNPVKTIDQPVVSLSLDMIGEKIIPCPSGMLFVPDHPHEYIDWNNADGALRLYVDRKMISLDDQSSYTCANFADHSLIATGSLDGIVRLWQISRASSSSQLNLRHFVRCHEGRINRIATCKAWSMIVSGGEDGKLCFLDLNKTGFFRSVSIGEDASEPIRSVAIMNSTGYVAACSSLSLRLFTINARPIARLSLSRGDSIHCLSFHEREYSHRGVLASGGDNGSVVLRTWRWAEATQGWRFETIREMKSRDKNGGLIGAVRFVGECLYTGDEQGRVYSWDLPD